MKFSEQLKVSQIKIWAQHYVDYVKLKELLYHKFRPRMRSSVLISPSFGADSVLLQDCGVTEHEFETTIDKEAARVNTFFQQSLRAFSTEADLLMLQSEGNSQSSNVQSVRHATIDLYRRFHYLRSYAIVNYTAFVKILKKHDKVATNYATTQGVSPHNFVIGPQKLTGIDKLDFCNWNTIDEKLALIETLFAKMFCHDNKQVARGELLMIQNKASKRGHFWLGYKCGAVIMLGLWVLWDCIVDAHLRSSSQSWNEPCYKIYSGLGCVVLLLWLWGCNVYIWNSFRVNYLFILELSDKTPRSTQIFSSATTLTFVFLTNFLLFYKAQRTQAHDLPAWMGGWHARLLPLSLFVFMAFKAVTPWKDRKIVWHTIGNILRAPFAPVRFRDFYAADVWTSLVKPSVNIAFGVCYFVSGSFIRDDGMCDSTGIVMRVTAPVLSALPLCFRFMQCIKRYHDTRQRFPNLANAGKYALSHTVVFLTIFASNTITNTYQVFWAASLVLSTLYTFYWDVKMDWTLGSRSLKPDIFLLRDRLMFRPKWVYYVAIVADLIMRFLWTLTLVSFSKNSPMGEAFLTLLQPFLASVELVRRTMWGCFRLEAEHLQNTEGFRTVEVIPLHFATPVSEERDEPEPSSWRTTIEVLAFSVLVVAAGIVSLVFGELAH